jgi:hypothetical protein
MWKICKIYILVVVGTGFPSECMGSLLSTQKKTVESNAAALLLKW